MTNAVNLSTVAATGFLRNRIINGAMVIDQRNAGAVVTVASGATNYIADRFAFTNNASNSVTIQQVTDAPADFSYSSKVTIGSANTLGSTQYIDLFHNVEGYNFADMAWGTVSAKTITVSFWVKSSVSGTHGGMVINNANNRTFAFTYTISAANTWEYETVTIPGDVTGTWNTTNLRGVALFFTMGSGATYLTSPNVWTAGVFLAPTTAVNLAAVAGATWQITGVQLEVGTVATPFERRLYGTELALCQRYYEKSYEQSVVPGTASLVGYSSMNNPDQGSNVYVFNTDRFAVQKRTAATMRLWDLAGNLSRITDYSLGGLVRTDNRNTVYSYTGAQSCAVMINVQTASTAGTYQWDATAEL